VRFAHTTGREPRRRQPIAEAAALLANARRPVIYTGGGVINAGPRASELLRELAALTGAPVTSTLMGLGAFPAADPQWLGMLGMHGSFEANNAMHDCDVMICDRRALRRPGHGAPRRLLAGLEEDPHRHRPLVHRQERPRRRRHRRRRRQRHGRPDRGPGRRSPPTRPGGAD
jgi:hypothetical protein